MNDSHRPSTRERFLRRMEQSDATGWFEELYSAADRDPSQIPWADLKPNPNLVAWLDLHASSLSGRAIKIGCGLGDDAEELARRGLETTAFDISETAIAWSQRRFPNSPVSYRVADLFSLPRQWLGRFGFVLESYTLQALPPQLHADAIPCVASLVAPGGLLLLIARGREPEESFAGPPWPLTNAELLLLEGQGLRNVSFEDYPDDERETLRRFRAVYRRAL